MKRWDITQMQAQASRVFAKLHKHKKMSHFNHDIHFLARDIKTGYQKAYRK
jgi:RNA-directed DNA polymerase